MVMGAAVLEKTAFNAHADEVASVAGQKGTCGVCMKWRKKRVVGQSSCFGVAWRYTPHYQVYAFAGGICSRDSMPRGHK